MATQTIIASTPAPIIRNYPRGDSRILGFTFLQSDGKTPFDLTGCEVFFTVNPVTDPGASDSGAVIEKSTTSFVTPSSGVASITLTNADTQNINPATYYYDVQLKDANGNITSLMQNTFQVIPDITRRIT